MQEEADADAEAQAKTAEQSNPRRVLSGRRRRSLSVSGPKVDTRLASTSRKVCDWCGRDDCEMVLGTGSGTIMSPEEAHAPANMRARPPVLAVPNRTRRDQPPPAGPRPNSRAWHFINDSGISWSYPHRSQSQGHDQRRHSRRLRREPPRRRSASSA